MVGVFRALSCILCLLAMLGGVADSAHAAPPRLQAILERSPEFAALRIKRKTFICPLNRIPAYAGKLQARRTGYVWKRLSKAERRSLRGIDARCQQLQRTRCGLGMEVSPPQLSVYMNESVELTVQVSQRPGCPIASPLAISTFPSKGDLEISDARVTYTPAKDYVGSDEFSISVSNQIGNGPLAVVQVSVLATPECSNGTDDNGDGLIDYPVDPSCESPTDSESPRANRTFTYAFAHWQYIPVGPFNPYPYGLYSWNTPHPPNFHPNVRYPYVLAPDYDSLNPEIAKAYLDQEPVPAMHSWTLEQVTPFAINYGFHPDDDFPGTNSPSPWMDNWLQVIRPRTEDFFRRYKDIGGKVDMVSLDLEWLNPPDRSTVMADPRFTAVNGLFSPGEFLFGALRDRMGDPNVLTSQRCGGRCGDYWFGFFLEWFGHYLNKGIYEPIAEHFPQALVSNFNWFQYDFEQYFTPMFTLVEECIDGFRCSKGSQFGSAQQVGLAYGRGVIGGGTLKLDGYNFFEATVFNNLMQGIYALRGMAVSDPSRPIVPLIAGKSRYAPTGTDPSQDYYAELVFHTLLSGAHHLNYWTEPQDLGRDDIPLGRAMAEFDTIMGPLEERTALFSQDSDWVASIHPSNKSAWARDWIHSCMKRSAEVQVCRFTPRTIAAGNGLPPQTVGSVLLSEVSSSGQPEVTFLTRQKRIVFPGGRVVRLPASESAHGYWIVMPLDASVEISPSGINALPTARLLVLQTDVRPYEILIDAEASSDSDGRIIRWRYDFNDDGIFGDAVVVGDGIVPDVNLNPYGNPAWFQFTYKPTTTVPYYSVYVAPEGEHTVALEVTDDRGGVSIVRSTPFVFSRPFCGAQNTSLFGGGPYTCPLAQGQAGGS